MERSIVHTARDVGRQVRQTRITLGLTQEELAMAAGTGARFIVDLEAGKPTCELEKTLTTLKALGIQLEITLPAIAASQPAVTRRRRV